MFHSMLQMWETRNVIYACTFECELKEKDDLELFFNNSNITFTDRKQYYALLYETYNNFICSNLLSKYELEQKQKLITEKENIIIRRNINFAIENNF